MRTGSKSRKKFKAEKIDGLFLPHCNFGTEFECARLAKDLNVPVLLWGFPWMSALTRTA